MQASSNTKTTTWLTDQNLSSELTDYWDIGQWFIEAKQIKAYYYEI